MLNQALSQMGFQKDGNCASLYIKKPSTYNQILIMVTDNESGDCPTNETKDFAISVSYIDNHGDTIWSFNTWDNNSLVSLNTLL
jgi:hypothetical protein